jgi:hypothetical protein
MINRRNCTRLRRVPSAALRPSASALPEERASPLDKNKPYQRENDRPTTLCGGATSCCYGSVSIVMLKLCLIQPPRGDGVGYQVQVGLRQLLLPKDRAAKAQEYRRTLRRSRLRCRQRANQTAARPGGLPVPPEAGLGANATRPHQRIRTGQARQWSKAD